MIFFVHQLKEDKWPYEALADLMDICPKTRFSIIESLSSSAITQIDRSSELTFIGDDTEDLLVFDQLGNCMGFVSHENLSKCIREYVNAKNSNVSEIKSQLQKYIQK